MMRLFPAIVMLFILSACAPGPPAPTAGGSPYPAQGAVEPPDYGLGKWLADLAAANAGVKTMEGSADQGFDLQGRFLEVDGARVSAYEFASAAQAAAAAAGVSPDGSTVTRAEGKRTVSTHSDYIEHIHWYHKGRLIVAYAGDDARILDLLTQTLGTQFAGGFKLWDGPTQYP